MGEGGSIVPFLTKTLSCQYTLFCESVYIGHTKERESRHSILWGGEITPNKTKRTGKQLIITQEKKIPIERGKVKLYLNANFIKFTP